MKNPLLNLNESKLPPFSKILPEHVEPALDKILADNREQLKKLLSENTEYTWDNLMHPVEAIDDHLSQMWSIVNHLHAVMNSDALRDAYHKCLPKISEYSTEMGQNTLLYEAVKSIGENKQFYNLNYAQQKVIENELRDFRLAGVNLDEASKKRYAELQQQLAHLTTLFEENLLDATQGWSHLITDPKELNGIPEHAVLAAKETAQQKQLDGWLFTLEFPSYQAVLTYAQSEELRKLFYTAYVTRSSDQGPEAGKYDNTEVMRQILTARKELAHLLGFNSYAEFSLVPKMAKSPDEVLHFLNELAVASVGRAKEEYNELKQFAKEQYGVTELEAWDIAFYSEKLLDYAYSVSQEALRPYFPEHQVLEGLFNIVHKLFGITVSQVLDVDVWHPDVKFFQIIDQTGLLRGQFYLDLYARPNKRGGAWMDECRTRRITHATIQTPIAFLTCNFNRPIGNEPALFTHEEVLTLFHEFGHGLQHMLTTINYADVAGINGVPWDAVELSSQFLENWCWEKPALDMIARHYKTGEHLPDEIFERMHRARNFQSAMQMVRQLEFALFDFRLHMEFEIGIEGQIQRFLDEVRQQVCVRPVPQFNRFQHGFSHIFAGGYAAGYYSYKWAEVLSSDAFSKFEETGIFNEKTGKEFLNTILEKRGGRGSDEFIH